MSQNFSLVNHGFVYLCLIDDGTYWIRSVSGRWTQITANPLDTFSLQADLDAFILQGIPASENDVKVDDASQIIVEPIKVIPPPPPPDVTPVPEIQPDVPPPEEPPADPPIIP